MSLPGPNPNVVAGHSPHKPMSANPPAIVPAQMLNVDIIRYLFGKSQGGNTHSIQIISEFEEICNYQVQINLMLLTLIFSRLTMLIFTK